ncbi:MAG: bile acid:sodium symporter [Deltaproteobacteria bacterium]|nr:bile acid:sodium symporter [Deltaproteobacteria bacterium]
MSLLEKLETFLIVLAMVLGLILGQVEFIGHWSRYLISPLLIAMLFGLFLKTPLKEIGQGFKNLKFALTSLGLNFLWIPILGYGLGEIFLQSSVDLKIGFLMLLVTPCTDWYLIFTAMAKGNVPLSTSILPLNLILQILLLPVYLLIFAGLSSQSQTGLLLASVFWILVLPLGASLLVKRFLPEKTTPRRILEKVFAEGVFKLLWLAILFMFASEASQLLANLILFKALFPPVILFFVLNFFVGRLVGGWAKFSREDKASLTMTTLARNSPVSLALAVVAFPDRPFIALALVIGPLIEIPVLAIIAKILLIINPKADIEA